MNLPDDWQVPTVFRQRLGTQSGRQRIMEADGHLLVILHGPPTPENVERDGRFFWRSPNGDWRSTIDGKGIDSLTNHLNDFQNAIVRCEKMEDAAEEAREYFDVLRNTTPLQRTSRHLAEVLQDARKACPVDRDLINIRDRAANIERAADLLASDAKNAMDFAIARQAERQAASSQRMSISAHKLNLFVAFFFPVATLCAIFSTTFRSGLEDYPAPWPLLGVLAIGVVLGMVLTIIVNSNRPK